MDLYCKVCAEPWDNDSFHEEAEASGRSYDEVTADFRARGCLALNEAFGPLTCTPANDDKAAAAGLVYELLGDDMDGAAAMLEDLGLL